MAYGFTYGLEQISVERPADSQTSCFISSIIFVKVILKALGAIHNPEHCLSHC